MRPGQHRQPRSGQDREPSSPGPRAAFALVPPARGNFPGRFLWPGLAALALSLVAGCGGTAAVTTPASTSTSTTATSTGTSTSTSTGTSTSTSTGPSAPAPAPAPTPQVTITGLSQVRAGAAVQLSAAVTNTSNTAVTWLVNGVPGGVASGAAAAGTITANGVYTAPALPPAAGTVLITANTQAAPLATATQVESILNPVPVLTSATAAPLSVSASEPASPTAYTLDLHGTGFLASSQIEVQLQIQTEDGAAASTLATTFVSPTELTATLAAAPGAATATIVVANPDPGTASSSPLLVTLAATTASAAGRLLDQTSFGPTQAGIAHVQQVGLAGYLAEQFAAPPTPITLTPAQPTTCTETYVCFQSQWWQQALTGQDQLRERVAFALSELFVVSTDQADVPSVMAYHNTLAADAFGNFSTLLKDVTVSAAMGQYLDVLNSSKAPAGQIANENYARELMQLFTLGLVMLNPDGTPAPGGAPVFTEDQVGAFARAFTGWTYATAVGGVPARFPNKTPNYWAPMVAVESAHDTTAKPLLLATTLPSGQSAEQDLDGALANIFNHPNVGPFVCTQLIQHLVTSNPEPAYVERVANVFANNGQGVRGDMKAVLTAILTDPDARAGDSDATYNGGHLREAVLWTTGVMRGLGFVNTSPTGDHSSPTNATATLGQSPYTAGSVFDFFPPDYVVPGTAINAPEFGQENTATSIARLSLAELLVFNRISGYTVDLSATGPLGTLASATGVAQTDSANLVDTLGLIFLHGQMSPALRTALVNHVATLTNVAQRVRVATYLVITSSEYKIEH